MFNKLQFFNKSSNFLIRPQIIIHQIYLNLHVRRDVNRDLTEDIELGSARSCLRLGSKLGGTDPDKQVGIPGFQEKVLAGGVEDNILYFDSTPQENMFCWKIIFCPASKVISVSNIYIQTTVLVTFFKKNLEVKGFNGIIYKLIKGENIKFSPSGSRKKKQYIPLPDNSSGMRDHHPKARIISILESKLLFQQGIKRDHCHRKT